MGWKTYQADFPSQYPTDILTFLTGAKSVKTQIFYSIPISHILPLTGAFQNEHSQSTLTAQINTIPSYICICFVISHSIKQHWCIHYMSFVRWFYRNSPGGAVQRIQKHFFPFQRWVYQLCSSNQLLNLLYLRQVWTRNFRYPNTAVVFP